MDKTPPGGGGGEGGLLPAQGLVRDIIHLYCLAVQAGFYSDVVVCSTIDGRFPGSILGRGMKIL